MQMDKALKVEKEVVIQAGPDQVWHALTDRESIKKYFFGTEAISDWKVGSSLIFRGEWEGKTYQDKGSILAAEPGRLLQYDLPMKKARTMPKADGPWFWII
jgi:uncharacterized protein YndB with AHSA1/START domain